MHLISREEFENHPLLSRLLELADPPEKIYIDGQLPDVIIDTYGRASPRILTVVGSRKHTSYAQDVIEHLFQGMKGQDVVIISGLALGVDTLAHTYAMKNNLTTWAIPGSGLDRNVLYPRSNQILAEEILASGGCMLSEFDPQTIAAPWTFPARNRVMAALSDAVLIIEAETESGTLITGRQALELGRDIGAIPGSIFSTNSDGTNMLIKEGAYVIRNIQDLMDLLHLSYTETQGTLDFDFSEQETLIMKLLGEPKEKDVLLVESKLPPTEFLVTLSSLEMKGVIRETFGEVRRIV